MVTSKALPFRMKKKVHGFTYLGVLIAIAFMGIGLTVTSEVWFTLAQQQRKAEVEWIGEQYVQAIGSYFDAAPNGQKIYPPSIADLLEDKRFPTVRRHLRAVYLNPFSNQSDWQPITDPAGHIRGIRCAIKNGDRTEWIEFLHRPAGFA